MANNFPNPKKVLVISAHPDDPEFSAGGLIARWAEAGAEITYVIVTDGSKGTADPQMTKEKLVAVRQLEQRAAAEVLGAAGVVFLGQPDGEIRNTYDLREMIVRQIRTHKPEVIITHDPTTRILDNTYLNHTDHRVVGDIVLDSVYPLARDRLNFPEHEEAGLEPHKVLEVFLSFSNEPNYWVDISATIEKKVAAIIKHASQISSPEDIQKWIPERAAERAAKVSFEYAETFRRVQLLR